MTGIPDKNKRKFEEIARVVKSFGLDPITPFDLNVVEPCNDSDWVANMKRDIKFLMTFDGVVVLPGWELSKGARVEVALAHILKLPVFVLSKNKKTNKPDLESLPLSVNIDIALLYK